MERIKETNCPGCERHCPSSAPSCNWGRNHFGLATVEEKRPLTWAEKRRVAKKRTSAARESEGTVSSQIQDIM